MISAKYMEATRVETTRFGVLEVAEDLMIELPEGLIGFEDCRRHVVLHQDKNSPFRWLQSLDDGAVAFPIINPRDFMPGYAPTLAASDVELLGLTEEIPPLLFTIVTVPRHDPRALTANLLGPIVINPLTRQGKQVVVLDDCYTTRHSIMKELAKNAPKHQGE